MREGLPVVGGLPVKILPDSSAASDKVVDTSDSGNHICIYQVLIRNAHPTMQINNLFHREMSFPVENIADSTFGAKKSFEISP